MMAYRIPHAAVGAWVFLFGLATSPALARQATDSLADTASSGATDPGIEGLPIARIVITPRAIFDPVPKGAFSNFYNVANLLHIKTRESTIRRQLLFAPGDPWRSSVAQETERNLRALHFIEASPLVATRRGDSVDVFVVTHDTWTTQPSIRFFGADGERFGSISLIERNFLGIGKSFEVARGEGPDGGSRNFLLDDPNLFGSRMRARTFFQSGSAGSVQSMMLGLPFYAQASRRSYSVAWTRQETPVRLYRDGVEVVEALSKFEEVSASWGFGSLSGGTIRRLALVALGRDRSVGPSVAPAPDLYSASDVTEYDRTRRLGAVLQLWRPHFLTRTAVNHLDRIEDFDVGSSVSIEVGEGLRSLGNIRDETYVELGLNQGVETRTGLGLLSARGSARLGGGAREILLNGKARWVDQSLPNQTLVFAATVHSGSRMPSDFQAVSGGLDGLRAFPLNAVAGDHLWQLNVEDRLVIARNVGQLVSLGAAGFYDAARALGPGTTDTGWYHGAGVGLRLSLPRSTRDRVMRFDVAWPISPSREGGHAPVYSFGADQAF